MHDPDVFDDPFEFKPERYIKDGKINPNMLDADAATFGFGRRCAKSSRRYGASDLDVRLM